MVIPHNFVREESHQERMFDRRMPNFRFRSPNEIVNEPPSIPHKMMNFYSERFPNMFMNMSFYDDMMSISEKHVNNYQSRWFDFDQLRLEQSFRVSSVPWDCPISKPIEPIHPPYEFHCVKNNCNLSNFINNHILNIQLPNEQVTTTSSTESVSASTSSLDFEEPVTPKKEISTCNINSKNSPEQKNFNFKKSPEENVQNLKNLSLKNNKDVKKTPVKNNTNFRKTSEENNKNLKNSPKKTNNNLKKILEKENKYLKNLGEENNNKINVIDENDIKNESISSNSSRSDITDERIVSYAEIIKCPKPKLSVKSKIINTEKSKKEPIKSRVPPSKKASFTIPFTTFLPNNKYCVFCKNNGEEESVYRSHLIKDVFMNVKCPYLATYVCPHCKATGTKAHTISKCPLLINKNKNKKKEP